MNRSKRKNTKKKKNTQKNTKKVKKINRTKKSTRTKRSPPRTKNNKQRKQKKKKKTQIEHRAGAPCYVRCDELSQFIERYNLEIKEIRKKMDLNELDIIDLDQDISGINETLTEIYGEDKEFKEYLKKKGKIPPSGMYL